MKVLYHADCNDGSGAAFAVWKRYGDRDMEYIPCRYGRPLPEGLSGQTVLMVDFSASREEIQRLAMIARRIVIIDHHKSAQEDLKDIHEIHGCSIKVVFNMEKSGAVLAWEYFHTNPVPVVLRYVEDWDLWRRKMTGVKEVHYGLQAHPEWRAWGDYRIDELEQKGRAIVSFIDHKINKSIQEPPVKWYLTEDTVPIYNIPKFMVSDALHRALDEYPESPYAVGYFDYEGKREFSLRSRKNSDVDVSEIAKKFGGGGHKHAAGFIMDATV